MPGICGYLQRSPQAVVPSLLDDMLARLDEDPQRIVARHSDASGRFALGSISLGIVSKSTQPAGSHQDGLRAVFDGELYDMGSIRARLGADGPGIAADDFASALLATYAQGGIDAFATLEGSFAAAVFDVRNQTLTLVSDAFGSRPLYYAQQGGRFGFASRIAALLADESIPRDVDWQGISQFFTFGHYFNDDTSFRDVKILPAGTALTFDAGANQVRLHRYWSGTGKDTGAAKNRQAAFEQVDHALFEAVRRRGEAEDAGLGLALSGGLDARTILGVFEQPAQRIRTVCLGMAGSRDHRASSRLAAIVGCSHHSHVLDAAFLGDFRRHLEQMVRLTDGQYLSQCIVMPTLPLYRELGIGVLLRGHGGELMHLSKAYNYSVDREAIELKTDADLEGWLWKRLQAYLLDGVDGPLFARPESERPEAARDSLRRAIAQTAQGERPVQRISQLFLAQRLRRETPLSLMKFRSVVEPRMPYMDRTLVELLLRMPAEWRLGEELQAYILRKRQPKFCSVENTNTGAVLGAGKTRRAAAEFRMRVCSKLGLPGYQPYERLGLWLRRELAPLVEEILLDEACLERGVFAPDTVRTVVRGHLAGARNHTYLILAMMVFEVGFRSLFAGQSFDDAVRIGPQSHQPLSV